MKTWLETLRGKSLRTRQQYAYIGSSIVTGLIVLVWFTTQSVGGLEPAPETPREPEQKGAFGRFMANVSSQVSTVWQSQVNREGGEAVVAPESEASKKASPITLPMVNGTTTNKRTIDKEPATNTEAATASTTASSTTTPAAATPPPARQILIGTSSPETRE